MVQSLRQFGHVVLTALEAGQANQGIPDLMVLAFAISMGRAVLTLNRRDYIRLHKQKKQHEGIIICTKDDDLDALAQRIHQAILKAVPLANKLIRVNKPP